MKSENFEFNKTFPVLKESVPQLDIKYSVQPAFSSRSASFTESIDSDVSKLLIIFYMYTLSNVNY